MPSTTNPRHESDTKSSDNKDKSVTPSAKREKATEDQVGLMPTSEVVLEDQGLI